jgi:hypothetical protein
MTLACLVTAVAAELLAAAAAPARAAPASFLARVERSEVRLGEPFAYEIEIRHPAGESCALPAELGAPPFRATARGCRRDAVEGEVRTTCAMTLALFDLGAHDIPEVLLEVETAGGRATLAVPGRRVAGVGAIAPGTPPGSLALRDLAPPVPLLVPSLRPVAWALALALALAVAGLARRAWRARARTAAGEGPPEDPHARLSRRLDALEARELAARGDARELYFELSGAVREHVGAVTGLNALELTTGELLERLEALPAPPVDPAALRRFCEGADLVKFARAQATAAEREAALGYARGLAARREAP